MTVQDADDGDTTTMQATLIAAAAHLEMVLPADDVLRELVTDKGFHSNDRLVDLAEIGIRTYISEPDRGRRYWRNKPEGGVARSYCGMVTYASRGRSRKDGMRTALGRLSPMARSHVLFDRVFGIHTPAVTYSGDGDNRVILFPRTRYSSPASQRSADL